MSRPVIVDQSPMILPFAQALYQAKCQKCNETLEWKADFDADAASYSAECCDFEFSMYPETMRVEFREG
jgi:hypothetical protein